MTGDRKCTISALEIKRKVFHILLGCHFFVALTVMYQLRWLYLVLLGAGLLLSVLQEKYPLFPITWILKRFDRPNEDMPGRGIITFFTGVFLVCFIFPREVALTSILALTFGDPFAYLAGCGLGRFEIPWNRKKTLEGALGFFGAASLFTVIYQGALLYSVPALLAAVVETLDLRRWKVLDDNITVSLTFGLVMYLLTLL